MDINYFGLLRLAQEFGPALKGRSADGDDARDGLGQPAVDLRALATSRRTAPSRASKAAAHSLAQCLRAEMRPAGIRVINVFPGPIDDEWNQHLPPPKLAPAALASAIVKALRDGVEDVYPGDVAQEWLERWRDNPKVLERELAAGGAETGAALDDHDNRPDVHAELLGGLVTRMASGRIRVVDLTQTLTPEFPQIALPPEMGQCWPFRIEEVSRYDERGPGWYWNNFSCGEHTGTHFDAPIHWISGRDLPNNSVDTHSGRSTSSRRPA